MSNLSNEQIRAIIDRLIEFQKNNPASISSDRAVGNNTGYSATTINQFKNGKYPASGSLSEIALKVANYLDNVSASQQDYLNRGTLKFAMTTAASHIFKAAHYALTQGTISVITGVPGCGKTHAVKEFKRRNPTSVLIEVTPLVTRRSLIEDICNEIRIPVFNYKGDRPVPVSSNELFRSIVNVLGGTKRLLIIDEGENLTVQCLEVIRRIQDFTEIGMLLSGTGRLLDRLRGTRKELQQLFSRVGYQKEIRTLELDDVRAILDVNYPEAKNFAATFLSLSKHNGRYLQHLISLVKRTVHETGEPLSDDLIDSAASSLLT
ncbi:AAA family ATPase [Melioribacter sp. Ez-97]|uniref:AAA family ATPase n=1 Tax=Melioribacter sp. Ez-97 TaxID=3423434 RepID=UPI003ED947DB